MIILEYLSGLRTAGKGGSPHVSNDTRVPKRASLANAHRNGAAGRGVGQESTDSGFFSECISITDEVMGKLIETVGTMDPEAGMMLGSGDGGRTIDACYFDESGSVTSVTYSPDVDAINSIVLKDWNSRGIRLVGFAHSHPRGYMRPSRGDLAYAQNLLSALPQLTKLAMPIVRSKSTGGFELHFFVARKCISGEVFAEPCSYKVVRGERQPNVDESPRQSRISKVYPPDVMARKTVVVVGCGGASEYVDHLVRCGVGRIVLFDGDVYELPNLQTQQVFIDEIGENKAIALAKRMRRINPSLDVVAIPRNLDDGICDDLFVEIVGRDLLEERPKDVLVAGCTDNFFGQLRSSRLAMKLGCPFIGAQVYEHGAAGEIMFLYPGVTDSCPRCMASPRYKAFMEDGYENTVGSDQAPIFSSQYINAMKGFVSSMLLLYGEAPESRFNDELDRVANRNFAMMRLSCGFDSSLFSFVGEKRMNYGETLWFEQHPDDGSGGRAVCPECGGKGPEGFKEKQRDTRLVGDEEEAQ